MQHVDLDRIEAFKQTVNLQGEVLLYNVRGIVAAIVQHPISTAESLRRVVRGRGLRVLHTLHQSTSAYA